MYKVLTKVTNGDKIVMERLDDCISTNKANVDDEDYAVTVEHNHLVDEDSKSVSIIKDLLTLVHRKRLTKLLHHPVFVTFIQRRWAKTRWMFLVTFFLYLFFVILFSSFLGMMYTRSIPTPIRIPVKVNLNFTISCSNMK